MPTIIKHLLCSFKQEWKYTNSICGKICMILFYSFVWLQLLGALWSQFSPTTGWECLFETVQQPDVTLTIATIKSLNIWLLGFFLYANHGGIKVWNVLLVWVIYLLQWLVYRPTIEEFLSDTCPDELQQLKKAMVATEIWISITLVLAILDSFLLNMRDEARPLLEEGIESRPLSEEGVESRPILEDGDS